jgi:hypothetical protein
MKATAVCVLACLLAVDAASLRGAVDQERQLLGATYCAATPFLTSVQPVMKPVSPDNGWSLLPIISSGDSIGGYKLPRNPVSALLALAAVAPSNCTVLQDPACTLICTFVPARTDSVRGALCVHVLCACFCVTLQDGIGAWRRGDNTVRIAVNSEVGNTEPLPYPSGGSTDSRTLTGARVSYFDVDKTTKAIKCAGVAYNTVRSLSLTRACVAHA